MITRPNGDHQQSDQSGDERDSADEHASHHQSWAGAITSPRAVARSRQGRIPYEGPYAEKRECLPQAERFPYHCDSLFSISRGALNCCKIPITLTTPPLWGF
jgi:hypothetical protein